MELYYNVCFVLGVGALWIFIAIVIIWLCSFLSARVCPLVLVLIGLVGFALFGECLVFFEGLGGLSVKIPLFILSLALMGDGLKELKRWG